MLVNKTNILDKDYVPSNLVLTDSLYKDGIYLENETFLAFKKMQKEALKEGYKIDIMSGYRDYEYQKSLYDKLVYEKGKNYAFRSVAMGGASEHQTGLAVDFCVYMGDRCYIEHDIADLMATKWVHDNCSKYGFIVRYPFDKEEITKYNYEPWHLRYVGDWAMNIYKSGKTLEEYLGKVD